MTNSIEDYVGVIIPTYNRYTFLIRAIESVLSQTYKNVEIFVIDDCSTHQEYNQLHLVYKDKPNVHIIRNEINFKIKFNTQCPQGETRNVGINQALKNEKIKWIAFLDDDDFWFPTKIEKQLNKMYNYNQLQSQSPTIKPVLISSTNGYFGLGLDINTYTKVMSNLFESTNCNKIIDFDLMQKSNFMINSSVIVHIDIIKKTGLLQAEVFEDYKYWKRCLVHSDCLYIEEPLVGYDTQHGYGQNYIY
jgi:teichuronic acid biosynthesis glycosyltransferase TuaG